LRLIQERKFRPLGADQFREADVRIIAASNRDLAKLVSEQRFRSDLYFRLDVLRVHLPPLRERPGDVALLARHFVETMWPEGGAQKKFLSPASLRKLEHYHWPGNIRELYNTVQRAVLTTPGREISSADIEVFERSGGVSEELRSFHSAKTAAIERFERDFVQQLLEKHMGNVSRAAREAGKDRRAFGRLAKKYLLKRPPA
jgi:transcriptional regulator with GAF, ATPase, and Fis domain